MANWKLGRRLGVCDECSVEFAEGDAHFSSLGLSAEEIVRIDVCPSCWPAVEQGLPEGSVWWRARRPLAGKRGLSIDPEGLMQVFQQLEATRSEKLLELRYVLSLLLMRKRRLFLTRALRKADAEFLVLRRPRRKEEQILVQVFELAPERMESLREDLERLFEGGEAELSEDSGAPTERGRDEGSEAEQEPGASAASEPRTEPEPEPEP
jgi:hypothetical protein